MDNRRIMVWFRNDLRIQDHEALHRASLKDKEIVPIYIIDPRVYEANQFGIPRIGPYRRQFLTQTIENLRQNLRSIGGELFIRVGHPETIIPDLVKALDVDTLYAHKEITSEETEIESLLEASLEKKGILTQWFDGSTLIHPTELPFPLKFLPDVFTEFRKQVEKSSKINAPYPAPTKLKVPGGIQVGNVDIPTLETDNLMLPSTNLVPNLGKIEFMGGETAALARLEHYFWETDQLKNYKETRNGLLGMDYSSKFSPWLAVGAISSRYIYHQVKQYEAKRHNNDSTYWLVFELLWRDYFKFVAKKYGNTLFRPTGIKNINLKHRNSPELFGKWASGQIGAPFVDANMRELLATGFMSNRGRQNVASYFIKDLGLNWQLGAAWFEYLLLDYDPCSNWGNWNYMAGCGNDPRENRYFNIAKQAETYDPKGHYVKTWLPILAKVPAYRLNHPDEWTRQEQEEFGVKLGQHYPHSVQTGERTNHLQKQVA